MTSNFDDFELWGFCSDVGSPLTPATPVIPAVQPLPVVPSGGPMTGSIILNLGGLVGPAQTGGQLIPVVPAQPQSPPSILPQEPLQPLNPGTVIKRYAKYFAQSHAPHVFEVTFLFSD